MSRILVGSGLGAVAAAMIGSDFIGGFPKPPRPGEGHKRAKGRLAEKAASFNYTPGDDPAPETRHPAHCDG